MNRPIALLVVLALLFPWRAQAHLGSPDVFFDGQAGPYSVRATIRVPVVVPGRAHIEVQIAGADPVQVAFAPIASTVAVSNAPPPETGELAPGETNLFTGELWLMTVGAYSIDVRVHGKLGDAAVQIPVNSIATKQLPLPPALGWILAALGLVLFCGAIAIVAAAAGESVLPPQMAAGQTERRRYWRTAVVTGIVLALALVGGRKWWNAEERDFRARLIEGGWPPMDASVNTKDSQRILSLTLNFPHQQNLVRDHGKLLHLFLVRQPKQDAFAHIHPVRTEEKAFAVVLPPLPEGDYELFCDSTIGNGLSYTATNIVHVPAASPSSTPRRAIQSDPDDSWITDATATARDVPGQDTACHLPGGLQLIWKAHPAIHSQQDPGLRFEVRDAAGKPVALEPYMGMLSHGAVLRSDDRVFSHLHPSGNYSMAAQYFFDTKMARETGTRLPPNSAEAPEAICGHPIAPGASEFSLPYQFSTPGNYRLWVQIKTAGQVQTAVFDTTVL